VTAETAITAGRRFAEARMTSTCIITRTTEQPLDEDTLRYPETVTTVYTGPCKVRFETARVFNRDVAGQIVGEQLPILFLPVDTSAGVNRGDIATITGNPEDPSLVGVRIRVNGQHAQTWATARRLPAEIVT